MNQREKDYEAAHKIRWGRGWKVLSYNAKFDGYSESGEMDYFRACAVVRDRRREAREKESRGKPIMWPDNLGEQISG